MIWLRALFFVCVAARAIGERGDHPNDPEVWADEDDDSQIGKAIIMIPDDPDFMSKFPGVKQFVKKSLPLFHAVHLKLIPEDKTELRLYTVNGEVSEAFDINEWDADEIDDFLLDDGFFKKQHIDDEVPAIYINGTLPDEEYDHDEL